MIFLFITFFLIPELLPGLALWIAIFAFLVYAAFHWPPRRAARTVAAVIALSLCAGVAIHVVARITEAQARCTFGF